MKRTETKSATKKKPSATKLLLPLAFIASAVNGIGLHMAGHGYSHEEWHNWAVTHVVVSLVWLFAVVFHIKHHAGWYKSIITRGIGKKSRMTLLLSAAFLFVTITGIVLLVGVDGANSAMGLWHYRIGLLLTVVSIIHVASRKRRKRRKR